MTRAIYELAMKKGIKPIKFLAKLWTNGDINKLIDMSPKACLPENRRHDIILTKQNEEGGNIECLFR